MGLLLREPHGLDELIRLDPDGLPALGELPRQLPRLVEPVGAAVQAPGDDPVGVDPDDRPRLGDRLSRSSSPRR